ncbi:MAG TPA: hypothetical protein QGH10_13935 [Armatimonadota bacterium]|nr:hypothetical protein [Armatimonadota bacterium]
MRGAPGAGPPGLHAAWHWGNCPSPQTVTCHAGSVYAGTELATEFTYYGIERTSAVGLTAFQAGTGKMQGEFWTPSTEETSAFLQGAPVVTEDAVYVAPLWNHGAYALAPGTLSWDGTTVPLTRAFAPMLIDSLLVSKPDSEGWAVELPGRVLPPSGRYSFAGGKVQLVTHIRGRAAIVLHSGSDYVGPIDIRTFERLWKRQILVSGWGIGTENAIVVPGAHREPYREGVYALDINTGEEIWHFTTDQPGRMLIAHMAFSNGCLLLATTEGWLYCLAPS